jgi:hypothetical protein
MGQGLVLSSLKDQTWYSASGLVPDVFFWNAHDIPKRADAEIEAPLLADFMLARGDSEGRQVWARIRLAIEALQASRTERVH